MNRPRLDLAALVRLTELADYIVPFALRVAADLNVADQLSAGPRTVEELSRVSGTDAGALGRLLRCLARKGVFAEVEPGRFALTPMAELLTSHHALSLRDAFPLIAADLQAWARVDHSLRTGQAAFPSVHGKLYWEHMQDHPEASRRLDRAVESSNRLIVRMFGRLYDWNRIHLLVDVGAGNGSFLAGLLARHPGMRGVVFDQPHVLGETARVLDEAGVQDRCEVVAGSFFEKIPENGDAYLLKTILHDWDDQHASAILRVVRDAISARGCLLVIEALLDPGDRYDIGKLLDLNSFVLAGGVNRTAEQYESLFCASGFRLQRIVRTTNALALLEASPSPKDLS
jgi:hypothetical protein